MTEYMVFLRIIEPNDGKKNIVADDLSGLQKPPNAHSALAILLTDCILTYSEFKSLMVPSGYFIVFYKIRIYNGKSTKFLICLKLSQPPDKFSTMIRKCAACLLFSPCSNLPEVVNQVERC